MDLDPIALLQQMPIFGGVDAQTLAWLHQRAPRVEASAGELVFDQGDLPDALYVLEQGQAVVLKRWQGRVYRLNSLQVGDCFGEMAIIDVSPRSAAVEALEDLRAMRLATGDLYDLYERQPDQYLLILMNMAREISRRLRLADERLFLSRIAEGETKQSAEHYLI